LLTLGCGPYYLNIESCPSERLPEALDKITVQYLGVGGFLISWGDPKDGRVILTAPLYSNPSLVELLGDHALRPDAALIDRLLPAAAQHARAILVGHSHYDHLMDVPYVALHKAKLANVYGTLTTARLLAPLAKDLAKQSTAVIPFRDEEIWDHTREGRWKEVAPEIRVAAIRSEHSAQATLKLGSQPIPFHLWRGERSHEDAEELPRSASEWAEGGVLAYVVDFMDAGRTRFRIYYQDSGTNEPIGLIPAALKAERDVDLAIVCVGGAYERLDNHPEAIIRNTHPRYVLLAHWEDFFVTQDAYCSDGGHYGPLGATHPGCKDGKGRIYGLPSTNFGESSQVRPFLKRVERAIRADNSKAQYWLPCPTRSIFDFAIQ